MAQKNAGEITRVLERLYEGTFESGSDEWIAEGGAELLFESRWLRIDARREPAPYATVWCRREFEGDCLIEYSLREEPGAGRSNLNFIVYAGEPDGSSVLARTDERTGEYDEYKQLNNYIFTFANEELDGVVKSCARLRGNPGFNLLEEAWRDTPVESGRAYNFSISIQGPRIRLYVDGDRLIDHRETTIGPRRGHHAFRTWRTAVSSNYFRVNRVI